MPPVGSDDAADAREDSAWIFPQVLGADFDDVIALGADLEPGTILQAYRAGLFPMRLPDEAEMAWWSPRRRGVLPAGGLRVTRSMRQSARRMDVRVDTAFDEVIAGCADASRSGHWIDPDIEVAYRRLHRLGWAHSVETWVDGELVGGLYGVAIGGLFAGESMFHRVRDASKVALMGLVDLLADEHAGRRLLDAQWATPHLRRLGVVEIPRDDYLRRLEVALELPLPRAFADPL